MLCWQDNYHPILAKYGDEGREMAHGGMYYIVDARHAYYMAKKSVRLNGSDICEQACHIILDKGMQA